MPLDDFGPYEADLPTDVQNAEFDRLELDRLNQQMADAVAAAAPAGGTADPYLPSQPSADIDFTKTTTAPADYSSLFNTGAKVVGDVAKAGIEAAANKGSSSSSTPAATPSAPTSTSAPLTVPASAPPATPAVISGAGTALLVGGAVVGTGLLIGILAYAARKRRRSVRV